MRRQLLPHLPTTIAKPTHEKHVRPLQEQRRLCRIVCDLLYPRIAAIPSTNYGAISFLRSQFHRPGEFRRLPLCRLNLARGRQHVVFLDLDRCPRISRLLNVIGQTADYARTLADLAGLKEGSERLAHGDFVHLGGELLKRRGASVKVHIAELAMHVLDRRRDVGQSAQRDAHELRGAGLDRIKNGR